MRMHSGRGSSRQLVVLEDADARALLLFERQFLATACGRFLMDNLWECVFRKSHIVSQQMLLLKHRNGKHYAGSCSKLDALKNYVAKNTRCLKNTASRVPHLANARALYRIYDKQYLYFLSCRLYLHNMVWLHNTKWFFFWRRVPPRCCKLQWNTKLMFDIH